MTQMSLNDSGVAPVALTFLVVVILVNLGMEYLEPMLSSLTVSWWLDVALLALVAALTVYAVRIVPPPLGGHR